ncbi:TPA: DUF2955 domain-containing protein [Enterobacter cloacae subsp. cloacae]|nr:DUF2955 domain-containing protein [Enterobacter cloacae subsp. cloacae]
MSTESVHTLDGNGWRQTCRMVVGSLVAWSLATLLAWPSPTYYAVYPLVLMGLVPVFNRHVALQFLASGGLALAVAGAISGLLAPSPLVMTVFVFGYAAGCFWIMTAARMFLLGAMALVIGSGVLHLGSYPDVAWETLFWAQGRAAALSVAIAAVAYALFPDVQTRTMPPPPAHPPRQRRHVVLLGASAACVSFVTFQVLDLKDSYGAQIATVLVLLALSRDAIWNAGRRRVMGTAAGVASTLLMQLLLLSQAEQWLLTACALLVGLLWYSAEHVRERAGPAHGFAAVTSVAILFGQLTPGEDLAGNAVYRAVSVMVAVTLMLVWVELAHWLLNAIPATRWSSESSNGQP